MAAVTQRQRRAWQTSLIHAKVSTLKNTLTLLKYCQTVAHFIQKRDQIEHPTDRTLTDSHKCIDKISTTCLQYIQKYLYLILRALLKESLSANVYSSGG